MVRQGLTAPPPLNNEFRQEIDNRLKDVRQRRRPDPYNGARENRNGILFEVPHEDDAGLIVQPFINSALLEIGEHAVRRMRLSNTMFGLRLVACLNGVNFVLPKRCAPSVADIDLHLYDNMLKLVSCALLFMRYARRYLFSHLTT